MAPRRSCTSPGRGHRSAAGRHSARGNRPPRRGGRRENAPAPRPGRLIARYVALAWPTSSLDVHLVTCASIGARADNLDLIAIRVIDVEGARGEHRVLTGARRIAEPV